MTADSRDDEAINALPVGTRFGELEITGTLGVGGFGIVYLARDHSLEREIAIKEYMPSQFAQRDGQSQVSVRSVSMKETFELGRRSFVNEAKLLARFDHPSLLKVYRFWEANGTAYMAMPRLVGQNLREARKARPTPPPEAWVRRIFDAVLGGLETLHAQHVWHRDVAPDNIFMPADGSPPILLDFGAARQAISDKTQVFTAILKPSFAPIEQYAEATTLRQGPWTDFYALAAAMHELLTGRPPPPATARAMGDELVPLAVPGYSPAFLAGLDWALRVAPHQRPQTVADWREALDGRASVPPPQAPQARTVAPTPPAPAEPLDLEFADTIQGPALDEEDDATVVVPLRKKPPPPPPPPPAPKPTKQPPAGPAPVAASAPAWRVPAMAGGGVLAAVLLGLFVMQLRGKPAPPEVVQPEPAASVAAPAAAPTPAPAPAPVEPVAAPPSAPASQPSLVPVPVKPVAAPASAVVRTPPASAPARRDAASKPMITERAGEVRPVPRSPVVAAPEPATTANTTTAPPKSAPASATPAEPPAPKTAGEACGGRVLFARAWCIDRQCEKPIYKDDPECVKLRDIRNSRANH
ncbi:serine/threonine protein kinase [Pelomonas saccharophila]|uniref:non-specific serine/threonine protein kinase n=1 Tax=Roseateles saccharophilus TaxID=304 RepID=A0ABU1YM78_ROSSA|nr:protein kinase [Roseateles saccharophilus]MDR7269967.1 serine/threonine protein kinase [Roseateles saccharophilus]